MAAFLISIEKIIGFIMDYCRQFTRKKTMLRFKHIAAYQIQGITAESVKDDVILVDLERDGICAFLTSDLDTTLYIIDRGFALETLMLKSVFRKRKEGKFASILQEEINEIQSSRRDRIRRYAVLVIDIEGGIDAELRELMKDFDDFVIYFDGFDKESLRSQNQDVISAIVASLSLTIPKIEKIEKLQEGSYLFDDKGKIIYSFNKSLGQVEVVISSPLSSETEKLTQKYASILIHKTDLLRVAKLFIQSLDREADKLKTFISGWTALEMFTNKVFSEYKHKFLDDLRSSSPSASVKRFLDRISEVMTKDKYTLSDKFNIVSHFLGSKFSENDVVTFKSIKSIRGKLVHGEDIDESTLPIGDIHLLLMRYLTEYIRSKST